MDLPDPDSSRPDGYGCLLVAALLGVLLPALARWLLH